jgi:hypothetical protein
MLAFFYPKLHWPPPYAGQSIEAGQAANVFETTPPIRNEDTDNEDADSHPLASSLPWTNSRKIYRTARIVPCDKQRCFLNQTDIGNKCPQNGLFVTEVDKI